MNRSPGSRIDQRWMFKTSSSTEVRKVKLRLRVWRHLLRENAKNAFVNCAHRAPLYKTVDRFHRERELTSNSSVLIAAISQGVSNA